MITDIDEVWTEVVCYRFRHCCCCCYRGQMIGVRVNVINTRGVGGEGQAIVIINNV